MLLNNHIYKKPACLQEAKLAFHYKLCVCFFLKEEACLKLKSCTDTNHVVLCA